MTDPDPLAYQNPPYTVKHAVRNQRYETLATSASFGPGFIAYSTIELKPGERKRMLDGKGKILHQELREA